MTTRMNGLANLPDQINFLPNFSFSNKNNIDARWNHWESVPDKPPLSLTGTELWGAKSPNDFSQMAAQENIDKLKTSLKLPLINNHLTSNDSILPSFNNTSDIWSANLPLPGKNNQPGPANTNILLNGKLNNIFKPVNDIFSSADSYWQPTDYLQKESHIDLGLDIWKNQTGRCESEKSIDGSIGLIRGSSVSSETSNGSIMDRKDIFDIPIKLKETMPLSSWNVTPQLKLPFNFDPSIPPPPLPSAFPASHLPHQQNQEDLISFLNKFKSSLPEINSSKLNMESQTQFVTTTKSAFSAETISYFKHIGKMYLNGKEIPSTRSKMIQLLVNSGFKKEEAGRALMDHQLDFECALGELLIGKLTPPNMLNPINQSSTDDQQKRLLMMLLQKQLQQQHPIQQQLLQQHILLQQQQLIKQQQERSPEMLNEHWMKILQQNVEIPSNQIPIVSNNMLNNTSMLMQPQGNFMLNGSMNQSTNIPFTNQTSVSSHSSSYSSPSGQNSDILKLLQSLQIDIDHSPLDQTKKKCDNPFERNISTGSSIFDSSFEQPLSATNSLFENPFKKALTSSFDNLAFQPINNQSKIGDGRTSTQFFGTEIESKLSAPLKIKEFVPGVLWNNEIRNLNTQKDQDFLLDNCFNMNWLKKNDGFNLNITNENDNDLLSINSYNESIVSNNGSEVYSSNWIQISQLPLEASENDMNELCLQYGPIDFWQFDTIRHVIIANYTFKKHAIAAQNALDGCTILGHPIRAIFIDDCTPPTASNEIVDANLDASKDAGFITENGLWIPSTNEEWNENGIYEGWNLNGEHADIEQNTLDAEVAYYSA